MGVWSHALMTRTVRCHCVVALFDGSLQAASMMSKHGNILFSKISPECHNTEKKNTVNCFFRFPVQQDLHISTN